MPPSPPLRWTPELAREIVQQRRGATRPRLHSGQANPTGFQHALVEELESRFTVEPVLGRGEGHAAHRGVGWPSGRRQDHHSGQAGGELRLGGRRPVMLLSSMDTYRVAAAEQLRSYAAHPRRRLSGARNRERTGAGHRRESRQGADLHRYPRVWRAGEVEDSPGLARFLSTRARYRHATGPIVLP